MKYILSFSIFFSIVGCSFLGEIDYSNSFWGELQSDENYLYSGDSLNSVVDKILKKGSIVFFYASKGDFYEVYTDNPKHLIDEESRKKARFYIYKPKYTVLNLDKRTDHTEIYVLPFDPNKQYFRGERGGCYYINDHGNNIYVDRRYCNDYENSRNQENRYISTGSNTKTSTNCATVQCSGVTQQGIRCKNKTTNCSGRCHLH